VKCGFSVQHVNGNDDSAMKLSADAEDDIHSVQPLGVQFENFRTCDSALVVCGIQRVIQVLVRLLFDVAGTDRLL
jgi:hypothetical protein